MVYKGDKRVHAIKFKSLALPYGLTGNLSGPYEGNGTILQCYTILGC